MPTYDYQCDACGHEMELFQSITDPVKRKCPSCGKQKLRRLFGTGAGIVFKGSGFYQTDYRSEKYKKRAAADNQSSSDSGKSDSGGSDSAKPSSASSDGAKSSGASGNGAARSGSTSKKSEK